MISQESVDTIWKLERADWEKYLYIYYIYILYILYIYYIYYIYIYIYIKSKSILKSIDGDLNIKLIDGEPKTDLFVKPTVIHQFLDPTSYHPYHCKKEIP